MASQGQECVAAPVLNALNSVETDSCEATLPTLQATSTPKATIAIADSLARDDASDVNRNGSGVASILRSLPTPARNRAGAGRIASKQSATPAAAVPRGPEPWDLPSSDAQPQSNSYRELLQVRGQQAMQRSRMRGVAPTPPPATAARLAPIPEAPATAAATPSAGAATMMPPNGWPCNMMLPPSVWFVDGTVSPQQASPQCQAVQQAPVPSVIEQLCGPGVDASNMARAPALAHFPNPATSQLACQDAAPVTPQARPSATTAESPCTPQELMTTLMGSGAFAMDEQQIAEALRGAAPCEYED